MNSFYTRHCNGIRVGLGINLYACVATLGLLSKFSDLRLPGDLEILTSWWVIMQAALYLIEFVADKVPWIDSTWDVVHTFIRVPAGAKPAGAFGDFDRSIKQSHYCSEVVSPSARMEQRQQRELSLMRAPNRSPTSSRVSSKMWWQ